MLLHVADCCYTNVPAGPAHMYMETFSLLILILFAVSRLVRYALDYLNIRYARKHHGEVPEPLENVLTADLLSRTERYLEDQTRLATVSSAVSSMIVVVFVFGGPIEGFDQWIAARGLPAPLAGWLYFTIIYLATEILDLPFSLWHTFKIEQSYGFNTTTPRLWLSDLVKSTLLSLAVIALVVPLAVWVAGWSQEGWWLWVWTFLCAFGVFVMYVSPYVIEPLFNTFTPLGDQDLRQEILTMVERVGVRVSRVLLMDASRRSKHSNAYFTGIGRTKRIVLFDTLVNGMAHNEVLAVLAHELGHWRGRHVLKSLIVTEGALLLMLNGAFHLMNGNALPMMFGTQELSLFSKAVLVAVLGSIVALPAGAVFNMISRHFERNADRFGLSLSRNPDALVSALVKLSKENLSNLHPHPLYAAIYYSHPPIVERIRTIRAQTPADALKG